MANWFRGLGEFAGGVAEGWDPWLKLSAEEKREREKLEAEAGGYGDLLAELRRGEVTEEGIKLASAQERDPYTGKLTGKVSQWEEPGKPFVTPAGKDVLPTLESRPLTRQQLIRGGISQKGKIGILEKRMALARADKLRREMEEREDEKEERTRLEREQTRFDAAEQSKLLQGTYPERAAAATQAAQRTAQQRLSTEARGYAAQGATPPPTYMPKGEGFTERPISPSDLIRMSAEVPGAKRTAAQDLRKEEAKIKLDADIAKGKRDEDRAKREAMFPKWQPDEKPSTSVEERRNEELIKLSEVWQTADPSKKSTIERQAQLLLSANREPMVTPEATRQWLDTSTSPPDRSGRSKAPSSPLELSKEDQEHLASSKTLMHFIRRNKEKYTDKDAKKNLTIWGQLNHWGRNIAAPAVGVQAWKDKGAARYMADADALTARALQLTHQMMGGGAFSEPDRILYRKTIPHTDTYSPVNYMAKMDAWSEDMESYVSYMSARQKIGELPRLVSELEPWQLIKYQGKKGEDGKEIISEGMAKMLIEYSDQGLNPDTNQKWTGEALMDYQKEHKDKGFSKDDLLEFIALLPYEVAPPR